VDNRIQIVSIAAAFLLVVLVIELVRRRRLNERYALLWLFSAFVILGLAIWQGLLERLATLIGVAYPPNALFLVAVAFILLLVLNFSAALSRLGDQTRTLAQRLAILEARQRSADQGSADQGSADQGIGLVAPGDRAAESAQQPIAEHDRAADD